MSSLEPPSPRATLRRHPERGAYDRTTVHAILDAGLVAHVAFVVEDQPFVLPMVYARLGDEVILHGAAVSRLQKQLATGIRVSLAVTVVDGLVLARSAYHHSMNYRSVVVFGTARSIVDEDGKRRAFDALVEHAVPGRVARVRGASPNELRGTHVLALAIEEATAKVRVGPPIDDPDDLDLPVWAGVIPLPCVGGAPVPAPDLPADVHADAREIDYRRT